MAAIITRLVASKGRLGAAKDGSGALLPCVPPVWGLSRNGVCD